MVSVGFKANEEVVDEGEVFGSSQFENEDEKRRVRVAKTGLIRGEIEDFFSEERIRLGGYEFLNSCRGTNRRSGSNRLLLLLFGGWGRR